MKKLVAPTAPTASDREEHTASGHAVFRTCVASDVAECINIVPVDKRPRFQRLPLTCCKRRREPRFWSVSVTVIVGSAQPLCQRKAQTSSRLLNTQERCDWQWLHRVRSDNEPAILALKESAATALKLAGVNVKISGARAWFFLQNGSENLSRNRIYRCSPLRVTYCVFSCNSSCCECCDCHKRDDW